MLIRGEIPSYYKAIEITNDTRGLYVNDETLELSYYMRTRMENNPLWQNITDIFLLKVRSGVCYRFNRRFWEPQMFNRMLHACLNSTTITFSELRT